VGAGGKVVIVGRDGRTRDKMVQVTNGSLHVLASSSGSTEVTQAIHDNLNANANVQQGNVDVGAANPLFVQLVPVPKHPLENAADGAIEGKPIGVGAANLTPATGIDIDVVPADKRHLITAWASNRTVDDRTLTLAMGGTGNKRLLNFFIPALETVILLDGAPLENTLTVSASIDATTSNPDVIVFGYFEEEDA